MKTKVCSQCKRDLALVHFDFANKSTGKKHPECKECRSKQERKYYELNRKERIAYSIKTNLARVIRNRQFVLDYLGIHPCVDCGETDIRVLEFDHRESENKLSNIMRLVAGKYSLSTIAKEIAKCDIRCANCHRKKTIEEWGWYRKLGGQSVNPPVLGNG